MARKCRTMSLEEHLAFGRLLRSLTNEQNWADLFNSFSVKSRQYRALKKFSDALETLKCVMDDEVCRMIPHNSELEKKYEPTRFYYGDKEPDDLELFKAPTNEWSDIIR